MRRSRPSRRAACPRSRPRSASRCWSCCSRRRRSGAQAPFVDRGISAIQIGDGGDATGPARVTRQQLERVGLALDTLVQRLDTTPESAGTVDAYLMLGERALPAWVLAALAASLLASPALVAGGLLVRAPGARGGVVAGARHGRPRGAAVRRGGRRHPPGRRPRRCCPTRPGQPRGDGVGSGAILLVLAGVAAGLVAALAAPAPAAAAGRRRRRRCSRHPRGRRRRRGAGAAGQPADGAAAVPALHAWALLPLLAGAGPIARVLVLVVPAAATFALFLAARGAAPAAWLDAIAAREVPGAVAVGLAVALAAAITAIPVVAGLLRGDRRPGDVDPTLV